ncbi:hypothetical protein L1887_55601 [Cichorium endivia]|nr:hypothetical protein L1887_55601 [Cichorium endivia]
MKVGCVRSSHWLQLGLCPNSASLFFSRAGAAFFGPRGRSAASGFHGCPSTASSVPRTTSSAVTCGAELDEVEVSMFDVQAVQVHFVTAVAGTRPTASPFLLDLAEQ